MSQFLSVIVLLSGLLAIAPQAGAQVLAAPHPNDYADKANWLCWPGRAGDACDIDLTTTFVEPDGSQRVATYKTDARAAIDCFYVYPTVSTDPGLLSTMAVEPAERQVAAVQFARFRTVCRTYAPMYRQFTLTALIAAMMGKPLTAPPAGRPETPYRDVLDAWNYYMGHENHGRGVVLIGHSQGSGVLTRLIREEIDGKPAQRSLVAAILMGTSLAVPAGADFGGDFKSVPLCHAWRQRGCVIAYASFRDTTPPPANSRFGRPRTPGPGLAAACVNPANLAGGVGELKSYFLANNASITSAAPAPPVQWVEGRTIATPFVSLPGLLSGRCVSTPEFNYLAVHVNPDLASLRTKDIPGDVVVGGVVQRDWGLHLIDANLAMGNLVDFVGDEGRAWSRP